MSAHPALVAAVEKMLDGAVRRHGCVALLYSGGIESSLLLHLAEPSRDHLTVCTVRTGAEFPHMVAFAARASEAAMNPDLMPKAVAA
jgi:3'-phosphoadenosine 5'-phosphosulfate sulfotransferase (PAPS reductase)/FAD synthetase